MLIRNFESLPLRKPTGFQSYISLLVPSHGFCISNSTPFQAHPGLQLLPIPMQSITRIVRFYETTTLINTDLHMRTNARYKFKR